MIVMEALSCMISRVEQEGFIPGFKVRGGRAEGFPSIPSLVCG